MGLHVEGLSFAYDDGPEVVANVSLTIEPGETIAILGRSGSGKTTLLKLLNLLLTPSAGQLELGDRRYFDDGKFLVDPKLIRRKIGMVFQGHNLFPNMSARNNIIWATERVARGSRQAPLAQAEHLASQLGIEAILDRYPESLSGGEAQRVAIARAMALEPEVLLLDEITSALDPEATQSVISSLRELRARFKTLSLVVVTHNVRFATSFADRIGFLSQGSLVDLLPAAAFTSDAKDKAVKDYLSQMLG